MNTRYIKCKRNVTLHEYDKCNIDSLTTMPRQALYSNDGQFYYIFCAWCMCVCVVYMVEDKFDDSPAVCHVFDDQVFIRSAVYCPYWSYNAMPLFFLKRIHKQAFSLIKDDSNNVGILNICDFIFLLSLFALDYLFRGILYM